MVNDMEYGLVVYIQIGDVGCVVCVGWWLCVGVILINGCGLDYGLFFGGYKKLGIGCEGGIFGFEDY